jgi:hypothetical protein
VQGNLSDMVHECCPKASHILVDRQAVRHKVIPRCVCVCVCVCLRAHEQMMGKEGYGENAMPTPLCLWVL